MTFPNPHPPPPQRPPRPNAYDEAYQAAAALRKPPVASIPPYPQAIYETLRTFLWDFSKKSLPEWECFGYTWYRRWNKAFDTYRVCMEQSFWRHLVYGTYTWIQRHFEDHVVLLRCMTAEEQLFLNRLVDRSITLRNQPAHRDWYRNEAPAATKGK